VKLVAVTLLLAVASLAQQTPAPTDFRIEGTVVDAETGQPLENVSFRAAAGRFCCGRTEAVVSSGVDGSFKIPLKSGGPYALWATRDGYVTDWPLSSKCLGANPGDCLVLTQCSPCTVTVRLHAASEISGRVVAADTKEPLAKIAVEAIRVSYASGTASSVTLATVKSDKDGEFSLKQLTPGQYFFRFTPTELAIPLIVPDIHDARVRQFAPQWWPGGDAHRDTSPFAVVAGTVLRLPDVLIPAASFQLSGTIQATACRSEDAFTVAIGRQRGASAAVEPFRSMVVRCGADYAFLDLTPGRYQLSLSPKDESRSASREDVVVTDRNLRRDLTPVSLDR